MYLCLFNIVRICICTLLCSYLYLYPYLYLYLLSNCLLAVGVAVFAAFAAARLLLLCISIIIYPSSFFFFLNFLCGISVEWGIRGIGTLVCSSSGFVVFGLKHSFGSRLLSRRLLPHFFGFLCAKNSPNCC